jgi:hypothetical protein
MQHISFCVSLSVDDDELYALFFFQIKIKIGPPDGFKRNRCVTQLPPPSRKIKKKTKWKWRQIFLKYFLTKKRILKNFFFANFSRQVPTVQQHLMSNGLTDDTMEASSSIVASSSSSSTAVGKTTATATAGSGGGRVGSASGSRSVSLASVSSDGSSSESHLVEQEDIVALTQEVRAFKEALGKLRRLFHPNEKGTRPPNCLITTRRCDFVFLSLQSKKSWQRFFQI